MKWIRHIFSLCVVTFITACGSENSSESQIPSTPSLVGKVQISFLQVASRTMSPENPDINRILIVGSGPNNELIEGSTTINETTHWEVATGEWVFQATAYNSDKMVIAEGAISIQVQADISNVATIALEERSGNGTFTLGVSWTEGILNNPGVSAQLTQDTTGNGGEDIDKIDILFELGSSDTYEVSKTLSLSNGLYKLHVQLKEDGETVRNFVDIVHILQGQTTSGNILFDDLSTPTPPSPNGDVEFQFSIKTNQSFNVALGSNIQVAKLGQTINLTAAPQYSSSNGTPNFAYSWYVDGEKASSEREFNFQPDREDLYDISLIATANYEGRNIAGSTHVTLKSMKIPFVDSGQNLHPNHSLDYFGDLQDYDKDGDLDYISSSTLNGVALYKNDGKGHFSAPIDLNIPTGATNENNPDSNEFYPGIVASADFDKNEYKDIVVANFNSSSEFYIVFNSEAGFGEPKALSFGKYNDDEIIENFTDILVYDENGDGWLDLAIKGRTGIYIFNNLKNENVFDNQPDIAVSDERFGIVTAFHYNFNGTSLELITLVYSESGSIHAIKWNKQDGNNYSAEIISSLEGIGQISYSRTADIDNDSSPELILASEDGIDIYNILEGGVLDHASYIADLPSFSVALADLDSNGFIDILVPQLYGGRVDLLMNDSGNLERSAFPLSKPMGSFISPQLLAADLDGDQDIDFISCAANFQINLEDSIHTTRVYLNMTKELEN